jgi:hypothetical protein
MQKIITVILAMLAVNFVAVVGGVGYLAGTGKLDKTKAIAIKDIVFPPTSQPTTQPTTAPATQPIDGEGPISLALKQMLEENSTRTAAEQNEVVRIALDSQSAELDRRAREQADLTRQLRAEQAQLQRDRADLAAQVKAKADSDNAEKLAKEDRAFKETLAIYEAMPAKQLKGIFVSMPEPEVVRLLQTMEADRVAKILKEFKTPEESAVAQRYLEALRTGGKEVTQLPGNE